MIMRSALAAIAVCGVLFSVALADVPPPQPEPPAAGAPAPTPTPTPETAAPAASENAQPAEALSAQELAANSLVQREGSIVLPGGQATVTSSQDFAFLDAADTKKLLLEVWGNPPSTAEGVLGAIVPKGVSVLAPESWAAIITYINEGHVADDDAASINYDDLLKEMQTETAANSEERVKAGYEAISLVDWAQKPSYDAKGHKLHWAKHLRFGKDIETLNYSIRVLGRTGVLEVNVVGDMKQLPAINEKLPQLLEAVSFNEGNRYADFSEGDAVAAYGLAALVAGGAAAKAGLFKGLLALLAASWKLIAAGVAAVGTAIWRFFGGRKAAD